MRRRSEAQEKADAAKGLAAQDEQAAVTAEEGQAGGDDPSLEEAAQDEQAAVDDDGDDEQPDPAPAKKDEDAPRAAPIMAPERKRPGVLRGTSTTFPEPNRPSFDWVRDGDGLLAPNLRPGEEVTDVGSVNGVEFVRTSCTRFIYLCTAQEYEEKVGELIPRETFKACFPHAFK